MSVLGWGGLLGGGDEGCVGRGMGGAVRAGAAQGIRRRPCFEPLRSPPLLSPEAAAFPAVVRVGLGGGRVQPVILLRSRSDCIGLLLAFALSGCGGASSTTVSPAATDAPAPAPVDAPASDAPATDAPVSDAPAPAPSETGCALQPGGPDLIAWFRTPGIQDAAQILGSVDLAACKPTADTFASTAPMGEGFCSVLATASANRGYTADASPVRRPTRGVLVEVGPAC